MYMQCNVVMQDSFSTDYYVKVDNDIQNGGAEKIKTRILCSMLFYSMLFCVIFANRAVYEIMWTNSVESGRPQMAIWCMRIACWITKAKTQTHTQNV